MELQLIDIGDSKGLIIPDHLIKEYGNPDNLDLIIESGQIIIKPKYIPRLGWEAAFKEMHANGDDKLLIDDIFEDEELI